MTQVSKPISLELTDDELDAVSGGEPSNMTQLSTASQQMQYMMSVMDSVIKNIGNGK
jgi:bacteriocin-like protein